MATLTATLASHMARCKKLQQETLKDLKTAGRIGRKRHDETAAAIGEIDAQLDKDPYNPELLRKREEHFALQQGLNCGVDYARGLVEQVTGKAHQEPNRHDVKDPAGRFTTAGSTGHQLKAALEA